MKRWRKKKLERGKIERENEDAKEEKDGGREGTSNEEKKIKWREWGYVQRE